MHTESAYDGWTAYCYPEQGMVDRLLRVHIQSQRAFWPWWTLSYNNFMGPGDGPSWDRVYTTRDPGATVRQYRHVVTPLLCLEMHAALMHCARMADVMLSEQAEAEQLEGDQIRLPRFERGEFTVADLDLNEVPLYQNDAFMSRVRDLASFDTVRAAQPADKGATSIRAQGRDWAAGEHLGVSKQHNQPGRALTATDRPREDWPAGTVRSPPPEPALLFSRDAHRHTPEVAADVVAQTCERLLTMREQASDPHGAWMLETHQQRMHMKALKSTSEKRIATDTLWTAITVGCHPTLIY